MGIPNGDDHVQVVELNVCGLGFVRQGAVSSGCRNFRTTTFSFNSPSEKIWLIRFKRTWPVRVLKNCEPPASLKPPSSPRKTFLESREGTAFKKIAAPFRETRNNATKREAFWLPHFSGGRQKSLLGVLRSQPIRPRILPVKVRSWQLVV